MFENTMDEIKKALSSKNPIIRRTMVQIIVVPFLFIWIIIIIVIGDWDANANLFNKWFYPNDISIEAGNGLDANAVSILWKTDLMKRNMLLYKNGEVLYDDFREQGDNYFTVLYRDQQIAMFDQVKKKGIYGHDYHFSIKRTENLLKVDLSIEGRDTVFTQIKTY